MKIIEIFEMIARDEEPPQIILFRGKEYMWNPEEFDYVSISGFDRIFDEYVIASIINEKVEVINITLKCHVEDGRVIFDNEENKDDKIKLLSWQQIGSYQLEGNDYKGFVAAINKQLNHVGNKMNELIKKVNKDV